MSKSLFPYQREALDHLYSWLNDNRGNPLVVLPTGAGKSVVIANLVKEASEMMLPREARVIMLTHVKELVQQNYAELIETWPQVPVGVYSASLNKRQVNAVTFASIQSVYKRPEIFGWLDIIIVDECHLIPQEDAGMYRKFIEFARKGNPNVVVIGFTATPYRMKGGLLTQGDDALFTDIAYELEMSELIRLGRLCRLVGKKAKTQADLSEVGERGGEYIESQMQEAFNKDELTTAAINEMLFFGEGRNRWLIFASGVKHAQAVTAAMNEAGVDTRCVTGDMDKGERDETIQWYKQAGGRRALVNCDVLTTGFNAPATDMLVFLRGTKSVGLYVQMMGRGMRVAEGKTDCLVLDFAGNLERHGPVDSIKTANQVKRERKGEVIAVQPTKVCPVDTCCEVVPIQVRFCPGCGYEYPAPEKVAHDYVASLVAPMLEGLKPERHAVELINYNVHTKPGKPDSMRVTYTFNAGERVSEWVCPLHTGFAQKKAKEWLADREWYPQQWEDIESLVSHARKTLLREPAFVWVRKRLDNPKYYEIVRFEWRAKEEDLLILDRAERAEALRRQGAPATPIHESGDDCPF
jgi:DNA repair protein RadD